MFCYRVALDVPRPLPPEVSRLPAAHRKETGTRSGTRAPARCRQAKLVLARFRGKADIRRPGHGSGLPRATACRYEDEGTAVPAAKAPTLQEALEKAPEQGLPFTVLDGTLVSSGRCPGKKTGRKGTETGKWYSGKAHGHAGLAQGLAGPDGIPRRVSGAVPGSTRGVTAARDLVLPGLRPRLSRIPCLAGSGCEGAGKGVHVPVRKPPEGDLDVNAKTRSALLRGLRCRGERGFALMKGRRTVLRRVTAGPGQTGDIAKAALVLTLTGHKMI